MKTRASRELYGYWDGLRESRPAPVRGDIDPRAIRSVLADTFFVSLDAPAGHPLRLAGTRVCALFGRELKQRSFLTLWNTLDAPQIAGLIETLTAETIGLVAGATARTDFGLNLDLELLLLPLSERGENTQVLGALTPLQSPYWLGFHTVKELSLTTFRHVGHRVRFATPPLPARPRLVVHAGGRA